MQQKIVTYNHERVVNLYVVYEITNFQYNNNPILTNALSEAVKLTKNADIEKYILDMELDLIVDYFISILLKKLEEM